MSQDTNFKQIWHARSQGKSRHDPWRNFRTGGVVRVTWPCKLWALNANISKTAKDTNFKFDRHAPRDSVGRREKLFSKGGVAMVTWSRKLHGVKC